MAEHAKKPRFTIRMNSDAYMDSIHSALDEMARILDTNTTRRDALWYLLEEYQSRNMTTTTWSSSSLSKQMYIETCDPCNQLFVGEVQQVRLLIEECQRRCHCGGCQWTLTSSRMQGHVLCCTLMCDHCKFSRRWLSSSLIGTQYTVNVRYIQNGFVIDCGWVCIVTIYIIHVCICVFL